jgi:hypothetical protein
LRRLGRVRETIKSIYRFAVHRGQRYERQDREGFLDASLQEVAVLRFVSMAADERLAVIWARDAGKVTVERHAY